MSAIDNIQDALQRSQSELNSAKGKRTDASEHLRRSEVPSSQHETDDEPVTGFQDYEKG